MVWTYFMDSYNYSSYYSYDVTGFLLVSFGYSAFFYGMIVIKLYNRIHILA